MVVLLVLAGSAAAVPACTNVTLVSQSVTNGTIISPINAFTGSSNSCLFDGLDFSNFSIYANTGYQSSSNLTVTVAFANTASGVALTFGTNMSQALGDDIDLQYEVSPSFGLMLLSASGAGGINEHICSTQQSFGTVTSTPGSFGVCSGTTLGTGSVAAGNSTLINVSASGTGNAWIFKDVNGVSGFSQTIVPEPMTLSLMGAGLLGLGFLRRFRNP